MIELIGLSLICIALSLALYYLSVAAIYQRAVTLFVKASYAYRRGDLELGDKLAKEARELQEKAHRSSFHHAGRRN